MQAVHDPVVLLDQDRGHVSFVANDAQQIAEILVVVQVISGYFKEVPSVLNASKNFRARTEP